MKLTTKKLKQHLAEQFVESFTEPSNSSYYVIASKHTPYSASGDASVPEPFDSERETSVEIYEEGIFGKKIQSNNVSLAVPKKIWSSGTVYDMYDDADSNLFNKDFYVAVDGGSTYYVYKVLDNNSGAVSIGNPSSNTTETACNFITTTDGYVWKFMYSLPESTFNSFATSDYMPVVTSANVSSNTINGAIDVVKIENKGSNYIATLTSTFQADDLRENIPSYPGATNLSYRLANTASNINDFYSQSAIYIYQGTGFGQIKKIENYQGSSRVITISTPFTTPPDSTSSYKILPLVEFIGDGTGAQAFCEVASNSTVNGYISSVKMVSRGAGYTYCTASVRGYTGGVSNNAVIRPIIPPPGGHGKNAAKELGSDAVVISTKFENSESGTITTQNDYRKIAVLKDPLFTGVILTISNPTTSFSGNERVHQIDYLTLTGSVSGSGATNVITGTGTQFTQSLSPGDLILLLDSSSGTEVRNLRQVVGVSNNISITVNAALTTTMSLVPYSKVNILATGIRTGNANPYVGLTNVEPKFITGKPVLGESSGAFGNVTAISVGEKTYNNWTTFDNRTRIVKTSTFGTIPLDSLVYQEDITQSNAYLHSTNNTFVFLTKEKGPINADPGEPLVFGSNTITLSSTKYVPDLVKRSGEVLYIENNSPISRSDSQTEAFKLTIKF